MSRRLLALLVGAIALLAAGSVRTGLGAGLALTSQPLTAFRTCTVTGTPTTTSAVTDATVRQASPTSSYGTTSSANVTSQANANRRLYVWFDLAQCRAPIPASAVVRTATLRLYATAVPSGACRTVDIFRVTTSWTEGAITWANQPFGSAIDVPPSGTASGSFTIGSRAGCGNTTVGYVAGATVTADVAAFVAGTAPNDGWMLRDDAEGSATSYSSTFATKEATLARSPQLIVTYQVAP